MTKAEAINILANIQASSGKELESALAKSELAGKRRKTLGAITGALFGALLGGGAGYGLGALAGYKRRRQIYDAIRKRRDGAVRVLMGKLDKSVADEVGKEISRKHRGIQTRDTAYGARTIGEGIYSADDEIAMKSDGDGKPLLSLMFTGVNASVGKDGPHPSHAEEAELFYNKRRDRFSDVQANTIFDDPIVADAYIDKIVAKIMENRASTGEMPRVRLVGHSAGGRGVVNFLSKMRERIPDFKADEIIGIDTYQYPWEGVPDSLRDSRKPVADRIVYTYPESRYIGSHKSGMGKLTDILSNSATAISGRKMLGLPSGMSIMNPVPGAAHVDSERMYDSALKTLSDMRTRQTKEKEQK